MRGRVRWLDELGRDDRGGVDGDGEADADVPGLSAVGARRRAGGSDRRIDADDVTLAVDERATGVARVDAASVWMAPVSSFPAPVPVSLGTGTLRPR